ncbi:hypothetical protein O9992_26505 [Vibrio lentus]|nr:hypothetical protein [Vibrio lentus]
MWNIINFPIVFLSTVKNRARTAAFYNYLSIKVSGGLAGAVYSFSLSEALSISGGNIKVFRKAMMSTIMLIIIERDFSTVPHVSWQWLWI